MAQNKTTLILNNLVVLNYPVKNSTHIQSAPSQDPDGSIDLTVQLPFLALLQKLDFVNTHQPQQSQTSQRKPLPRILSVQRQTMTGDKTWQDVIDFKKQKINWRFKSRMRSNSNEFIEGFPFSTGNNQPQKHKESSQKPGNETFSVNSSLNIDEEDWDEEVKGTLVCGCSNTFRIKVSHEVAELVLEDKICLQLSVWPTIRMPTGGSTIPLINTSFLFATRNHIEESYEIDFLVAQSLVNARKFIQASEMFRGIETRLLKLGTRDDLYRVMLLEIIIGESMSQHSQVSEKIFAFKRATLIHSWLQLNSDDVSQLLIALQQLPKEHVKQEEAPQKLFSIKYRLVAILIANVGSHIEVVRMAVLKTLEYLLDTLNCSLENQIVDILRVVCFCYPSAALTSPPTTSPESHLLPLPLTQQTEQLKYSQVLSFFQYEFSSQQELNQQLPFFSWYAIHTTQDCQLQDVKTLSHSYVQSALNCYNHILENMGIVLASASHFLLMQVFKIIILPQALNPKLPQELRIYLLKYADQILHICKGDISLPGAFLSDILEIIVQQPQSSHKTSKQVNNKRIRVQSAATQAVSPHFSNLQQVCLNLLQTMKLKYFTTLGMNCIGSQQQTSVSKGQKIFEWLVQNFSELTQQLERISQNPSSKPQTVQESRKLNILMGIVECVVQSLLDEEDEGGQSADSGVMFYAQTYKTSLQQMYCRNEESKQMDSTQKSFQCKHTGGVMSNARPLQQKMSQNLKFLQVFLPLTQPLVQLFNYSVASQDRLTLFKQVWPLLTQILQRLPVKLTKMPQLTLGNLVQPHLERLKHFMQTSSPSKHMLEFLQIVLLSITPPLQDIEATLLPTLLHTIPHNLHDEVFQVTSLMLEIYSTELSTTNMSLLVNVLVHKYTMRSKEHKMLVDKVVNRILLGQQSKPLFDCFVNQCLVGNYLPENSTNDDESVFFEKLGLLQECVQQMQDVHVWHFRRLLNRSNQAFERVFQINPRSKHFMLKLLLKLSEFYMKNCAPYNHYEYPIVQQANTAEFIATQINHRTAMNQSAPRVPFINALQGIQNPALHGGGNMVYSEPSVELFSIGHHDEDLYFSGGLDHPRVEMDPQVAAYLDVEQQPINRTRAHYQSQHVDYRPTGMLLNNHATHEGGEDIRHQSELYESPRQAQLPPLNTSIICDQVSIIDRDRLLLIQIHSLLIRQVVDSFNTQNQEQHFGLLESGQGNGATDNFKQDANIKLSAINLMQNLFANLLPTPSLKNMAVQDIIGQDRVNLVQPVRMQQVQAASAPLASAEESGDSYHSSQQEEDAGTVPVEQQQLLNQTQPQIQQTQSNAHLEMIPDFADIVISGQINTSPAPQEPSFPEEFECSDARYLCARVLAFLKISKYLEQIITTTSWANLKSLAICVLNLGVHIPNVNILPSKLQRHLKNSLQPLIIKLVQNSRDSESKAAALNTLASMTNLQLKQRRNFFTDNLAQESVDSPHDRESNELNALNLDDLLSDDIQISKHLELFRVNSAFVSVAIWQEVFDLQDDQNLSIREAAAALVNLCAPRESVSHFLQIKREQYKLKVNQILQKSQIAMQSQQPQAQYISSQTQSSQMEQTTSGATNPNFTSTMQSHQIAITNNQFEASSEQSSDHTSSRSQFYQQQAASESEVRSILQIFTLKTMPNLTLQTDRHFDQNLYKRHMQFKQGTGFQDLYEDQFLIDERIGLQRGCPPFNKQTPMRMHVDSNDEEDENSELHSESSSDEVYIFRRESSGRRLMGSDNQTSLPQQDNGQRPSGNVMFQKSTPQTQQLITVFSQENEDLGIIDLDDSELFQDDDFEELDDDKLPVLKNTYSKKNRPNNSKSVAIGSRSQGGTLKQLFQRGIIQPTEEQSKELLQQESADQDRQRYFKQKLVQAIGMDRIEELQSELDKGSKSSVQLFSTQENIEDLEYELSIRGGLSVASLPVPKRREIQSAGGKRNKISASQRSSNLHVLNQSETLFLPTDLKNLDIEEVQIFVKRKQRPVSGRGSQSVYSSYNSQNERMIRSLGSQYFMTETPDHSSHKTNKLIQTDQPEEPSQQQAQTTEAVQEPIQPNSIQATSQSMVGVTSAQKSLSKKTSKDKSTSNIVRVIQKVTRPESTLQKQKQIVTKQSVKKPVASSASKVFETTATTQHQFGQTIPTDLMQRTSNNLQKVKRAEIQGMGTPPQQQAESLSQPMFKKTATGGKVSTQTLVVETDKLEVEDIL